MAEEVGWEAATGDFMHFLEQCCQRFHRLSLTVAAIVHVVLIVLGVDAHPWSTSTSFRRSAYTSPAPGLPSSYNEKKDRLRRKLLAHEVLPLAGDAVDPAIDTVHIGADRMVLSIDRTNGSILPSTKPKTEVKRIWPSTWATGCLSTKWPIWQNSARGRNDVGAGGAGDEVRERDRDGREYAGWGEAMEELYNMLLVKLQWVVREKMRWGG